jgi:hypothetical protein
MKFLVREWCEHYDDDTITMFSTYEDAKKYIADAVESLTNEWKKEGSMDDDDIKEWIDGCVTEDRVSDFYGGMEIISIGGPTPKNFKNIIVNA